MAPGSVCNQMYYLDCFFQDLKSKKFILFKSEKVGSLKRGNVHCCPQNSLDCVANRYVLYYANVKKGKDKDGKCI